MKVFEKGRILKPHTFSTGDPLIYTKEKWKQIIIQYNKRENFLIVILFIIIIIPPIVIMIYLKNNMPIDTPFIFAAIMLLIGAYAGIYIWSRNKRTGTEPIPAIYKNGIFLADYDAFLPFSEIIRIEIDYEILMGEYLKLFIRDTKDKEFFWVLNTRHIREKGKAYLLKKFPD